MREADGRLTDGYDYAPLLLDNLAHYKVDKKFEVSPNRLKIQEIEDLFQQLGKGHFGDVALGILSGPNGCTLVAVKTPKHHSVSGDQKWQRSLLRDEMKIMAYLQERLPNGHENVLKLVGAITSSSEHFCILTEYCEWGSLNNFLQKTIENKRFEDEIVLEGSDNNEQSMNQMYKAQLDPSWLEDFELRRRNKLITTSDLLWFALQIAKAMEFLVENNVLHRDVALRNILIKPDFTLKVSDFGLSRRLKDGHTEYLAVRPRIALPVLCIALESLVEGRFTTHSECWSYGIIIWELFTFATKKPYFSELNISRMNKHSLNEIIKYLKSKCRLTLPSIMPHRIKNLVYKLWNEIPEERPSFSVCQETLSKELKISCPKIQTSFSNPSNSVTPVFLHPPATSSKNDKLLLRVRTALKKMYLQRFQKTNPFSLPFTFDIENTWVSLALREDINDLCATEDYAELLKSAFEIEKMLIIKGQPATGKTSLMRRLAYDWAKMKRELSHFQLVVYAEFREVREQAFNLIPELVLEYNKFFLESGEIEDLRSLLFDKKYCEQQRILLLLDGYDESALDKQCKELHIYFTSTAIIKPLMFNIALTTRPGYLTEHCGNEGRFIFADILGFISKEQKVKYMSNYFSNQPLDKRQESIAAICNLLEKNENLDKLAETPLFLVFICLTREKFVDGTIIELYCNTIWWLIDRHQKDFPERDIPLMFEFQNSSDDKFEIIQDYYLQFPQLHCLGKMALHNLDKNVFSKADCSQLGLKDILEQVGLLRKEKKRKEFRVTTVYYFPHRTMQEFLAALYYFCSNEQRPDGGFTPRLNTTEMNEYQKFLLRIALSDKLSIVEETRKQYFDSITEMKLDLEFDAFNTAQGLNNKLLNWLLLQCSIVQSIELFGVESLIPSRIYQMQLSLQNLVYLSSVKVSHCIFTTNSQLSFINCPSLTFLQFEACIFESNAQLLFANCSPLKKLQFRYCEHKNNASLGIKTLAAIDTLKFYVCNIGMEAWRSITDEIRNSFVKCLKLTFGKDESPLVPYEYKVSEVHNDNFVSKLQNCSNIEKIEITVYDCQISRHGIISFSGLSNLYSLSFCKCTFEESCQLYFTDCPSLEYLKFSRCNCDFEVWQSIADQVRNSSVKYMRMTPGFFRKYKMEYLRQLQQCEKIEKLEVLNNYHSNLKDYESEAVEQLIRLAQNMQNLNSIIFDFTKQTGELGEDNKERIEKAGQERYATFAVSCKYAR